MDFSKNFDDLRPYYDNEVVPAIQRIIQNPNLKPVLAYIYPRENIDDVIAKCKAIQTVEEFQLFFSGVAVNQIIETTSTGLTYSGIEQLDTKTPYLFIANHHDIVLDSAIMQVILVNNNHKTTQITFGSNLMKDPLIVDIGKLNKMFKIYRGGSKMEKYKHALLHSAYIRHVITERKESIWIAQREGRTKDGNDRTQSGLIKMLTAGSKDICNTLSNLNIVPVTISYEVVPCDIEKAREVYLSSIQKYIKQPNEDYNSIVNGIIKFKGAIHVNFGKPLNSFISELDNKLGLNEIAEKIVAEIDKDVHTHYTIRACNYIALDMLKNTNTYKNIKYTIEEWNDFDAYINKRINSIDIQVPAIREKLLEIYAVPLVNAHFYKN